MRKGILIVTVALFPISIHAQQRADGAIRTTVCDLLRQPEKYNRKLVEIDAHIAWSEEGSVIFDKNCTGSILLGVSPQMDTLPGHGKQYRGLMRRVKKTNVVARVSGTCEQSVERVWGHMAMFDSRMLTTSVSDVRAAPLNK